MNRVQVARSQAVAADGGSSALPGDEAGLSGQGWKRSEFLSGHDVQACEHDEHAAASMSAHSAHVEGTGNMEAAWCQASCCVLIEVGLRCLSCLCHVCAMSQSLQSSRIFARVCSSCAHLLLPHW